MPLSIVANPCFRIPFHSDEIQNFLQAMNPWGILIFLLTYVLISARRFSFLAMDRPAGALLGAVACVVFGVLSPEEATHAINGETIILLFGMMGMGAFLELDGFFHDIEGHLVRHAHTPARLLGAIVWGAGLLSALITNDAVCILGAPLVVGLVEKHRLPPLPFLLALATAANTGSVATLVGNPQNMLCAILGGLSYRDHLLVVGPLALVCLAINHFMIWFFFRKKLAAHRLQPGSSTPPLKRRTWLTLGIIAGTAVAYTLGADLAWATVTGFVLLMLAHRRDTRQLWPLIDWSVLLFFAGLFIVVEGFVRSGGPDWLFARFPLAEAATGSLADWLYIGIIFLTGSNIVSNVPFILVVENQMHALPNPQLGWEMLAMASTFAGNLTLLGSVANIIVAEKAHRLGGLGFRDHLKLGLPLALLTTLVGVVWLYLFMA